jgi:glyoxylase I family protein
MSLTSVIPFEVAAIDHVVLRVRDVDAALNFYVNVLGCAIERRQDEIGLIQLRAGSALFDLVDCQGAIGLRGGPAPGADRHNMDHVCLRLDGYDADALRQHLASHGVAVESEGVRYGSLGEGHSMSIRDPEGNGIELRQ